MDVAYADEVGGVAPRAEGLVAVGSGDSFCSCGGEYRGDDAGPRLEMPPAPFNLLAPKDVAGGPLYEQRQPPDA